MFLFFIFWAWTLATIFNLAKTVGKPEPGRGSKGGQTVPDVYFIAQIFKSRRRRKIWHHLWHLVGSYLIKIKYVAIYTGDTTGGGSQHFKRPKLLFADRADTLDERGLPFLGQQRR